VERREKEFHKRPQGTAGPGLAARPDCPREPRVAAFEGDFAPDPPSGGPVALFRAGRRLSGSPSCSSIERADPCKWPPICLTSGSTRDSTDEWVINILVKLSRWDAPSFFHPVPTLRTSRSVAAADLTLTQINTPRWREGSLLRRMTLGESESARAAFASEAFAISDQEGFRDEMQQAAVCLDLRILRDASVVEYWNGRCARHRCRLS